jgi:hypothetical protein
MASLPKESYEATNNESHERAKRSEAEVGQTIFGMIRDAGLMRRNRGYDDASHTTDPGSYEGAIRRVYQSVATTIGSDCIRRTLQSITRRAESGADGFSLLGFHAERRRTGKQHQCDAANRE